MVLPTGGVWQCRSALGDDFREAIIVPQFRKLGVGDGANTGVSGRKGGANPIPRLRRDARALCVFRNCCKAVSTGIVSQ